MVECNNDDERRIRIQRTLQRLTQAAAELEALKQPKATAELPPIARRDPRNAVAPTGARVSPQPPPCPKCLRSDRVEPEDQSGSSARWFVCARCGTRYIVPSRP